MRVGAKLGAYGLVLATALGGGAALGAAVGPVADADAPDADAPADAHADHGGGSDGAPVSPAAEEEAMPGGVLTSQADYRFEPERTQLDGVAGAPFRFRITGPDGTAVNDFELLHERELHLIVVSRDLGSYAHLHPTRESDGSWTVGLPALAPGAYRAFADFAPVGGPPLTLGVDLAVPGTFSPAALPQPADTVAVDGYQVGFSGAPVAGSEAEVVLEVRRNGEPVTDLEPYLGAFGHLVAIRSGDLAYLHVHPLEEEGDRGGPEVRFMIDVPSTGDYRLFFDFAHGGAVHTAAFTVGVGSGGPEGEPAAGHEGNHDGAHEEEQ